jgi:hypothetical protein
VTAIRVKSRRCTQRYTNNRHLTTQGVCLQYCFQYCFLQFWPAKLRKYQSQDALQFGGEPIRCAGDQWKTTQLFLFCANPLVSESAKVGLRLKIVISGTDIQNYEHALGSAAAHRRECDGRIGRGGWRASACIALVARPRSDQRG